MDKRLYSPLLILLCLLGAVFQGHAQLSNKEKKIRQALPVIKKQLKDYAEKYHLPGYVYGIVAEGKLVISGGDGYSNISKKIPADIKSVFRIASMTKSFVGAAILKLRDEGKIKLDDPAHLYIKELKDQKNLTAGAPAITIRNLLTHSAGFPEDNPWGDRQLDISEDEFIAMMKKGISFSTTPGTGYEYSNMGFAMLGYIIKKVTGMPYQKYISQHILTPLGMKNTYWEYSEVPEKLLAKGYRLENGDYVEQPMLHDGVYGAMGGMLTSMEDFAKYVSFHLSAWPRKDDKESPILKRSSLREMQQPWVFNTLSPNYQYATGRACATVSGYGYGMRWMKDCQGRVFTGHSGGLPGFGSHWWIMPEYGIGIIFFANHTYAPGTTINTNILDTLISAGNLQPEKKEVSEVLNQRKDQLVTLLPDWKNAEESGIFAVNFFPDYNLDTLKKKSLEIFSRAGKIIKVTELIPENNLRGTFIISCEKADIKVYFTLSPENPPLIQHLTINEIEKTTK